MVSKLGQFKNSVLTFFSFQTFKRLYERVRYKNMSRKQRIYFIVLTTLIPSLAILIGILTSCIYGVDYHSVAISLNRSTQRFFGDQYTNGVYFMSLATRLQKFPNGYFQISFSNNELNGATNYPSIPVRTAEGTPLTVDLYVKGKLNTSNMTAFYMKYGEDWMYYLRQKIPNIIIRSVSQIGFYDLTSAAIKEKSAANLSSFDQFSINIVSVGVQLPSQYLSNVNGTIGWNVFQKQAELLLLQQTSSLINTFVADNSSATVRQQYTAFGTLKASKDSMVIDQSMTTAIFNLWNVGFQSLNTTTSNNTDLNRQILWYYFQSYYNTSFNPQAHQVQFN